MQNLPSPLWFGPGLQQNAAERSRQGSAWVFIGRTLTRVFPDHPQGRRAPSLHIHLKQKRDRQRNQVMKMLANSVIVP
jgi:hypothetical protein